MNPRIIQVRHELSHEQAKRFKGLYLDRSHYDTVVGGGEEDIDVITADSRWVLSYLNYAQEGVDQQTLRKRNLLGTLEILL